MTGQFLSTKRGPVKLFAWSDPQSPTPADALRLHARDVRSLLVRAAAVDATKAYQLFDLDRGGSVPLAGLESLSPPARARSPAAAAAGALRVRRHPRGDVRRARLRLPARRAALRAGHGDQLPAPRGRSGGARRPPAALRGAARARLLRLLLRSFLRRRSGEKVLWGLGFLLFAVAAACEAVAQRSGWSPGSSAPTTSPAAC